MVAAHRLDAHPDPAKTPALPPTCHLACLRRLAAQARLSRRVAPEVACRLVDRDGAASPDACGAALLHLLPAALGQCARLRREGAVSTSFDEAWLLGLIRAIQAEDWASVRFALASRLAPPFRAQVRVLVERFARGIDEQAAGTMSRPEDAGAPQSPPANQTETERKAVHAKPRNRA